MEEGRIFESAGVFAFYPNKQITTGEGGSNCGCRIAECGLDQSTAGGNNRWKTTLNSIDGCLKVIDIFRIPLCQCELVSSTWVAILKIGRD